MKLVLLPGMDGTGILMKPLQEELGDISNTVLSYPRNETQSYEEATIYIRKQLPENEDIVLLAESYSGRVAYNLASSNISNIKGVIFASSFLSSPRPLLLSIAKFLPLSLIFRLPLPSFLLRWFVVGRNGSDEVISNLRVALGMVKPAVLAKRLRDIGNQSLPRTSIQVESRYIQGLDDRLVPSSCYTKILSILPDCEKTGLSGPHLLLETSPKECAAVIRKMLPEFV
jgi:pimeloyl-ACP methyl ester carboxylesterase